MKTYLDIVQRVLTEGEKKDDRTGTGTTAIAGAMFEHDMKQGFPLLTTKKMPFSMVASELEFFIKGITDKQWLQQRKNSIWNEWANPEKAPYGHDEQSKQKMLDERDLGPVYGFQWRNYNAPYENWDSNYTGQGVDQLARVLETLKTNPSDRRMIVMAWNPIQMNKMALPPCHYGFQVTVIHGRLNLMWNQRSVDVMLGLPFNIASYALLLHLLAKETGYEEGKLIGFLGDVHIYSNHADGAREQLSRNPNQYPLCRVDTDPFTSIFDWEYTHSKRVSYESHPGISFPIAV
ncbi:MAG: thymidylate synthase [Candidatus Magasanikbacteria bacterium CG10_big_fil_rev_8_21_14_0_10_47_10]|uniref:Thymidylate synthase n=1 Tax=Candidatus Magasanikbacteria bacterium CG10_big_fil_rev_8_21_14_0_10_47_10 TaxID=1974652 RepID=A0A2H0TSC1_9BACT|nr:MAG: thymidylate synthase [Candidatus Magasanikbacteria bacterium CG10_big_fil_rev_8_21_14_0_10_47_10]